ncbi:hypothetical protein [Marinifilum caeruleilacunae]|uniref:Uncharacterized protein n=1 Tax=Marinifilum caeruleilacunae TaxID=2499076 RepID=A0ABX1WRP4_9BACT|nr:hypothetical protein [Marinifilum caeruleilacunae]NOU58681.1 hypothetical protein [Marinifilum caeruleilacunae]
MDAILLKDSLHTNDVKDLILKGVKDMDINQDKRDEIEQEANQLSDAFVESITYHTQHGKENDSSYAFQIAVKFNHFTEEFRKVFLKNYKQDVLVGFGISAIWMGILNGLDAESGIMPNHPFKREIANCLVAIAEILDESKQ